MITVVVTKEELALIQNYLYLLFIQRIFERDSHILEDSGVLRTPDLYVELVNTGADRTGIIMSEVKHEFRKRGITVHHIRQDESTVQASFTCRDSGGDISIPMPVFRLEMYERMRAYLGLKTSLPITSLSTGVEPYKRVEPSRYTGRRSRHAASMPTTAQRRPLRRPVSAAARG
ncbi:hypothetical protein OIN60_13090 [Paenibacillus sp. P96]|uniref:Uncharacterized protein n=1 Tax=Paenibacillus zeirhizosphaerae TaxID=2987519 RepID=A0ABT9FT86_9BACL|nr:hypothetical protein [Paenibacillus sp. P96]MDP4097706.1 hypothetical protein [Paenibacillus sp. P96]